jgi:hypothetical protein
VQALFRGIKTRCVKAIIDLVWSDGVKRFITRRDSDSLIPMFEVTWSRES